MVGKVGILQKDIPSIEGINNGTAMAYKAIYKNNLLVIPTKRMMMYF